MVTDLSASGSAVDRAGADGLVLFNRFYQPDIDISTMSGLSAGGTVHQCRVLLRLRWIAILHGRVQPSLALSGGAAHSMEASLPTRLETAAVRLSPAPD